MAKINLGEEIVLQDEMGGDALIANRDGVTLTALLIGGVMVIDHNRVLQNVVADTLQITDRLLVGIASPGEATVGGARFAGTVQVNGRMVVGPLPLSGPADAHGQISGPNGTTARLFIGSNGVPNDSASGEVFFSKRGTSSYADSGAGLRGVGFGGDARINRWELFHSDSNVANRTTMAGDHVGVRPGVDNELSMGRAGFRWTSVFATNGTIQTSARKFKTADWDSPLDPASGIEAIRSLRVYEGHYKSAPQHRRLFPAWDEAPEMLKPNQDGESWIIDNVVYANSLAIQALDERLKNLENSPLP